MGVALGRLFFFQKSDGLVKEVMRFPAIRSGTLNISGICFM